MKPNIRTISNLTGFSVATVSNALNNKKGVNKDTTELILKTARDIGYLSEVKVSQIKLVVYKAAGSVVNDSPFFYPLISGVEEECRECGLDMTVCNLLLSAGDFEARLKELLNDPSSALLVLATEMDAKTAARFQETMAPVLILDNCFEELPFSSVLIDNETAAAKAVNYLIGKGHRRIGYLKGSYEINNFRSRYQGYLKAMSMAGLACNPDHIFSLATSMDGAYTDMVSILQKEPELPTAFFADNDMIALGALRAFKQNGYSVPNDISIVGFDDLPFCTISDPPLTTIKVHNYEMGCAAVRRLAEQIGDRRAYQTKTQIASSFVERDSVLTIKQ